MCGIFASHNVLLGLKIQAPISEAKLVWIPLKSVNMYLFGILFTPNYHGAGGVFGSVTPTVWWRLPFLFQSVVLYWNC